MIYRWNEWNIGHLADHGVTPAEAEFLVDHARPPFPRMIGTGKRLVVGRIPGGMYAQAIYVLDEDGTAYVIHCRPLNDREQRRYRRSKR